MFWDWKLKVNDISENQKCRAACFWPNVHLVRQCWTRAVLRLCHAVQMQKMQLRIGWSLGVEQLFEYPLELHFQKSPQLDVCVCFPQRLHHHCCFGILAGGDCRQWLHHFLMQWVSRSCACCHCWTPLDPRNGQNNSWHLLFRPLPELSSCSRAISACLLRHRPSFLCHQMPRCRDVGLELCIVLQLAERK